MQMSGEWGSGYRELHAVYDRWQGSYGMDYSRRIFPKLVRTLARHRITPSTAVDLGCGTGTMVLMLEREGWDVAGIDASPGMVAEAERKAAGCSSAARFATEDIRTFTLPRPVSLAISLYDVLNHLPSVDDAFRACTAVRRALRPGGFFVFDLNNDRCYRRLWTREETIGHPDFTMTLANSYDGQERVASSRVQVRFKDGREDLDETVLQRCFARKEMKSILAQAGFEQLEAEEFAFPGAPWAGRLKTWYVARVPQ